MSTGKKISVRDMRPRGINQVHRCETWGCFEDFSRSPYLENQGCRMQPRVDRTEAPSTEPKNSPDWEPAILGP